MNISHKLSVPALQLECRAFLLTHAAGRPIKAMRIAELFQEEEIYREASRFVLDNPGGWTDSEMSTLSPETLLKLEKRCVELVFSFFRIRRSSFTRRTWFLERVLKLGVIQVAKEYQCVSRRVSNTLSCCSMLVVSDLPRPACLCSSLRREMATVV